MITLKQVEYSVEQQIILDQITLNLDQKLTAVIGANGSGKSTFARLLNGLILPQKGSVLVDGFDTKSDLKQVRKKVGFVFQNPDNQIVYPIVSEDLAFGLKKSGLSKIEIEEKIETILERYQLSALKNRYTYQLSGGEKQMIAICGILLMEPEYIVFDEPTTLLDLRNKNRIIQMIKTLPQKAIVISHDLEMLKDFDQMLYIDQGKLMIQGSPKPIIESYIAEMTS